MSAARTGNAVTPIALVVLAAGTAAYAYVVDKGRVSDADREARGKDVFPSFRVDDVRRIELVHGTERLVLDRERAGPGATPAQAFASSGSDWTMTSPRQDVVDPAAIDALLRELEWPGAFATSSEGTLEGSTRPAFAGPWRSGPSSTASPSARTLPLPMGRRTCASRGRGPSSSVAP